MENTVMKIVAFGASSSKKSLNKTLATYAAHLIEGAQVEVLDLNDFEMPLFSEDREAELGQPQAAKDFLAKLAAADGIIISFAEHNGSYAVAYKNIFDWASRIRRDVFQGKPVIHLATSPGPTGGANVLQAANGSAPYFSAEVKGSLSIPHFYDCFDLEKGECTNPEIKEKLQQTVNNLRSPQ